MVGIWSAEISDIADMVALQMNGSGRTVGGDVHMDIAPNGNFRITVHHMEIVVQAPDAPAVNVTVTGYSAGNIDAVDGVWLTHVGDYNLVGSADLFGSPLTIPFSSATGIFGSGAGAYSCSRSELRFETDPTQAAKMARVWRRG